jgi:hypothetical protein
MRRLEVTKLIAHGTKAIIKLRTEFKRLECAKGKDISRALSLLGQYQALQLKHLAEHERLRGHQPRLSRLFKNHRSWRRKMIH